jgi:hypothetical protein
MRLAVALAFAGGFLVGSLGALAIVTSIGLVLAEVATCAVAGVVGWLLCDTIKRMRETRRRRLIALSDTRVLHGPWTRTGRWPS